VLPNVILIILDSARRDAFGCYGSNLGVTPAFDRLARESALLWDHQAAGSGSAQAHVSTFSGQHSARHRMVHNLCEVPRDLRALPLLLRELGYRTFGHSKASFIPPAGYEDQFGFDEMLYPGKASGSAGVGSLRDRLLDRLRRSPAAFNALKSVYRALAGRERQLEAAARYFDGHTSFGYLRDRLIEGKDREPVFAYATILHPHTPYFPPRRYRDEVLKGRALHPQSLDLQYDFHGYMNGNYGDAKEGLECATKLVESQA
jgi:arylsulfatase A-like enzyme